MLIKQGGGGHKIGGNLRNTSRTRNTFLNLGRERKSNFLFDLGQPLISSGQDPHHQDLHRLDPHHPHCRQQQQHSHHSNGDAFEL